MTVETAVAVLVANDTPGLVLPAGPQGASAYGVALQNGFVGTEAQWLASLKGTPGTPGASGEGSIAPSSFATRAVFASRSINPAIDLVRVGGYASVLNAFAGEGYYGRLAAAPVPAKLWHVQSADGAWWELRTPRINPYQLGAVGSDTADDSAEMAAVREYADAYGVPVYIPPGVFRVVDTALVFTTAVPMAGDASERCRILLEGSSRVAWSLPAVTPTDGGPDRHARQVVIQGVGFRCKGAGGPDVAVSINFGNNLPGTTGQKAILRDVYVFDEDNSSTFGTGIACRNTQSAQFDNVRVAGASTFRGHFGAAAPGGADGYTQRTSYGITLTGTDVVECRFKSVSTYNVITGVLVGDGIGNIEGIYVDDFVAVYSDVGFRWNNPASGAGSLNFHDSHCNCTLAGVWLQNVGSYNIHDNLFYVGPSVYNTGLTGLIGRGVLAIYEPASLGADPISKIHHNIIYGAGARASAAPTGLWSTLRAVEIIGNANSIDSVDVDRNHFIGWFEGVYCGAGTNNILVSADNYWSSVDTTIVDTTGANRTNAIGGRSMPLSTRRYGPNNVLIERALQHLVGSGVNLTAADDAGVGLTNLEIDAANIRLGTGGGGSVRIPDMIAAASDSAAATAGVPVGGLYRNGSAVQIRAS